MFSFFKKITGAEKRETELKELCAKGAVIVDVRTTGEYSSGHIHNSHNIPLQGISAQVEKIKKWNKPVIVCCASGMRSAQANSFLRSNGIEAYNGGGWKNLNNLLNP